MAARYGPDAQAPILVLYEELLYVRKAFAEDPRSVVLESRIAVLRQRIHDLYHQDSFPRSRRFPLEYTGVDPVVIQYPRDVFEERYGTVAKLVRSQTLEVTGPSLDGLAAGVPYMYVVDDRQTLRVWSRPFRFTDLVFGRNRATVSGVPVAHPTLVPERLRVTAAGEIVFIGEPEPAAAVVNTKSGHFWPPPSSASVVRSALHRAFGLGPRDLDVFTMPLVTDAVATRSDPHAR